MKNIIPEDHLKIPTRYWMWSLKKVVNHSSTNTPETERNETALSSPHPLLQQPFAQR